MAGAMTGATQAVASEEVCNLQNVGKMEIARYKFHLDVSKVVPANVGGGAPQWLGAQLVAPAGLDGRTPVAVLFCVHGGGYDKRYFDLQVPARTGYSMSGHFAERGVVVIAVDYLGISDSSRPVGMQHADRAVFATVLNAAAQSAFESLASGTMAPHLLPPLASIRKVGLAHSMGVTLMLAQQATYGTFDQLALLGYSVAGVRLTRATGPSQLAVTPSAEPYVKVNRISLRPEYYLPDVPSDVIEFDEGTGAPAPRAISLQATSGDPNPDASSISVPVFFGLSEVDISPKPHAEPALFEKCGDLTFKILKGAAHSHNVASTRHVLWDRILRWIPTVG